MSKEEHEEKEQPKATTKATTKVTKLQNLNTHIGEEGVSLQGIHVVIENNNIVSIIHEAKKVKCESEKIIFSYNDDAGSKKEYVINKGQVDNVYISNFYSDKDNNTVSFDNNFTETYNTISGIFGNDQNCTLNVTGNSAWELDANN